MCKRGNRLESKICVCTVESLMNSKQAVYFGQTSIFGSGKSLSLNYTLSSVRLVSIKKKDLFI